ncbi:unnamed protein product [Rotaria socialis]|uniref:Gag-like protein n=1 Tax=Rotaria socialis TaxID=392032 RepID=A0A821BKL8_9BILA|nr:unnamed protein product [Rotaria socialis]CAF4596405.1 unnamed protein product [Rotaria socialis]
MIGSDESSSENSDSSQTKTNNKSKTTKSNRRINPLTNQQTTNSNFNKNTTNQIHNQIKQHSQAQPINETSTNQLSSIHEFDSDHFIAKSNTSFPPYSIVFKHPQDIDKAPDIQLIEQFIIEWKNKYSTTLNITGRFGHEKSLLIFANDESSFEDLLMEHKWPAHINEKDFILKIPRILPPAYSLVIRQFFNTWNIEEMLQVLKQTYPSLIKITRMFSTDNKPLNLVRADFNSLQQVKKLLHEGRITTGHIKNIIKPYYPPTKINKCMKCFNHHHTTKDCNSPFQLCIRCGQPHPYNNNCQNDIKCVNCGSDHYAGHAACPEVQQIRKQIRLDQKEKQTQLLVNLEKDQYKHYSYNNQEFPLLSTQSPSQQQQTMTPNNRHTYASVIQIQPSQQHHKHPLKKDQLQIHLDNILTSFSNKMELRLQQLEERVIDQITEIEKKLDNAKIFVSELEIIIFETILPAIKAIQDCSYTNTRSTSTREDLTKYKCDVANLLTKRNGNQLNSNTTKSSLNHVKHHSKPTATQNKTKPTSPSINNENEST